MVMVMCPDMVTDIFVSCFHTNARSVIIRLLFIILLSFSDTAVELALLNNPKMNKNIVSFCFMV